ncbi:hypothetical protein D3C81_1114580 [compost metagenome]
MVTGELAIHLCLLQAQLLDAGFDCDFLIKQPFCLQGQINRIGAHLVGTQCLLRSVDLISHIGELLFDEGQLGRCFSGVSLDVLPDISLRNLLQKVASEIGVGILISKRQDAGVLPSLTNTNLLLKVAYNTEPSMTDHFKLHARMSIKGLDLYRHAPASGRLSCNTRQQQLSIFVEEFEAPTLSGDQLQLRSQQSDGNFQLEYLQLLPPPAKAGQTQKWRSQCSRGLLLRPTSKVTTKQRKTSRNNFNVQPQRANGATDHRSRLDQRDFGCGFGGSCIDAQRLAQIGQARQRRCLRFDLHNGIRTIDRGSQKRICSRCNQKHTRDDEDPPLVVDQST